MTVSPIAPAACRWRRFAFAAALLAAPLAACSTVDRTVPTGTVPYDYHLRHPVVLANEPSFLDVFPVGTDGRLDRRTVHLLQAFADDYRESGQGPVLIRAPDTPVDPAAMARTVAGVRQTLAHFGVRGPIDVVRYPVGDPRLASPLHLSYVKLQARVASRCGDWPDDLNSGATTHGWENRSYYNLGCASAKTFAAQIDDPRDILGPRAEDPTDVQLRTRAIGLLRGTPGVNPGEDPGTAWSGSALSPIVTLGGN